MSRCLDSSTEAQNDRNHGPELNTPLFLRNEICTVGKSSKLGMFLEKQEKGLFLSVCVDDMKLAGKKQTLSHCGK